MQKLSWIIYSKHWELPQLQFFQRLDLHLFSLEAGCPELAFMASLRPHDKNGFFIDSLLSSDGKRNRVLIKCVKYLLTFAQMLHYFSNSNRLGRAVRGGARGASAPTKIWQWVRRTPPQNGYTYLWKYIIEKKSTFFN